MWRTILKGTLREFKDDELADRAAAMTYYGILSLFPALLVLVSLLGLAGPSATDTVPYAEPYTQPRGPAPHGRDLTARPARHAACRRA